VVQKLKAKLGSPFKKSVIRQVTCGVCGWIVAAPSLAKLLEVGWRTGCESDVFAFMCKTCVDKHPSAVTEMDHLDNVFRGLPAAPENPIPCIGCVGPGHVFSRPLDEDAEVAPREDA
jgi:hypothetical protein